MTQSITFIILSIAIKIFDNSNPSYSKTLQLLLSSIKPKMMSKVFIILHLVIFFVRFGNGNVIDYLNEEEQEKEKPCENFEEGTEEKDKCLEELCLGNEDRFECQALKCKIRFSGQYTVLL